MREGGRGALFGQRDKIDELARPMCVCCCCVRAFDGAIPLMDFVQDLVGNLGHMATKKCKTCQQESPSQTMMARNGSWATIIASKRSVSRVKSCSPSRLRQAPTHPRLPSGMELSALCVRVARHVLNHPMRADDDDDLATH